MKLRSVFLLLALCFSFSNGFSFSYSYLKFFKQKAIDIIDHAGPKDDCSRQLKAWVADMFNIKKLWALKMLDASAKLQTGFLGGNIFHFGNYDECLNIRENKEDVGLIEGQYCTVALTPNKNNTSDIGRILDFTTSLSELMGIKEAKDLKHILKLFKMIYGICLPKSCNAESIQKIWNHVEYSFRLPVHVAVGDSFCSHKGKVPQAFEFDNVVFWGFGLFLAFICLATLYDMMFLESYQNGDNFRDDLLISFSLHKNAAKIFDLKSSANEDKTFSCITGIKAISMIWVIYGHKYTLSFLSGTVNMIEYFDIIKTLPALFITVAPFSVDTFLAISGLLLAYKYMQVRDMLPTNHPFPYFMFYFMRFLRLWPCLVATIFLYSNVLKYLADGPMWPLVMYKLTLSCAYGGWTTAIFATNYINFHEQCLEPAWYLAVDTQLYCIAPLLLYFLYKYPKETSLALISLAGISAFYAYYITLTTHQRWTPSEGDDVYHARIYQSTFVRMPAWIFGLLAGAVLYNFQEIKIPKVIVNLIWITIATLFFGVVLVNYIMIGQPYNEYHAALFNAGVRPSWALAVCLVITLCATGHGGAVNDLLSLKYYRPLIKVSYSVFLLHAAVLVVFQGSKRSPTYHNIFLSFHGFLGDLPFILIVGLLWCLVFESPFVNIGKLIIRQGEKDLNNKMAIAPNDKKLLKKTMPDSRETSRRRRSKTKKVK